MILLSEGFRCPLRTEPASAQTGKKPVPSITTDYNRLQVVETVDPPPLLRRVPEVVAGGGLDVLIIVPFATGKRGS
jgi:hypothetical protein